MKNVIETNDLTVFYGRQRGIEGVDLAVREGEVFGFLGPNGAGKTTTLRVLLDVIRPTRGAATLFGHDVRREGPAARARVGYVPGDLALPSSMRGKQYLDMLDSVRARTSDPAYRRRLIDELQFDPSRRIDNYSSGNRQKLGLIAAMMHKPDLLILDEPTAGLDPLMQQTILRHVREARDEGRTVFFSSHILPEVQAVCDRVGIIREGELVTVENVSALLARRFHRIRLRFANGPDPAALVDEGIALHAAEDGQATFEVSANLSAFMRRAAAFDIVDIETLDLTLEEVFLAYYGAE